MKRNHFKAIMLFMTTKTPQADNIAQVIAEISGPRPIPLTKYPTPSEYETP